MTLGENVKFLREAKGLTYEAVGTAVGTDGQNIFNLEKRKSKVSKFAPALAAFFEVDLSAITSQDLRSGAAPEKRQESPRTSLFFVPAPGVDLDDRISADEIMELLALYQQSTPRSRENIIDLARTAAKRGNIRWAKIAADKS